MPYTSGQIASAVEKSLPGRSVCSVLDHGEWIRHNYRVELDSGQVVWMKIDTNSEMGEACEKEAYVCDLLRSHELPAPRVLSFNDSRDVLAEPFIIVEHAGGRSLDSWLHELTEEEAVPLYSELGFFFSRLHSIQYDRSGWIYGAGRVLDRHPNDFMHRAVVVENAGQLVEGGLIDEALHRRMISVSDALLPELRVHTPSLVCSTLPWTICLDRAGDSWAVTRLTDLHDALYWDPVDNLAGVRYPAFRESNDRHWDAFMSSYGGDEPDLKRMKYYYLLTSIDAILGRYMEPHSEQNENWKRVALKGLEPLVEEIESL